MKTCPHCGGLIRPSVIKCVHCGMSLVQDAGSASGDRGAGSDGLGAADPTTGSGPSGPVAGAPAPTPALAATTAADPWVTPSARAEEHVRRVMGAVRAPRSVPTPRVRRVDPTLLLAGLLAIAGAVAAASALTLPWVLGRLTAIGQQGATRVVAELTFHASDSVARAIVLGVTVGASMLGLLWFWYGLDRGTYLPMFAHPALGLIASAAVWATVGASRLGGFFWEEAFVVRARDAGLTKAAMRSLLEDPEARTLAFEQLAGMTRLMVAAGLVLAGAVVGWWSQRDRG